MEYRSAIDQRYSNNDRVSVHNRERDIPSFIEPRPPLILNPFMRPRPQKGTNLLELFEEDGSVEEDSPELVQVYLRLKPSNVPSNLYEVRSDKCLVTSVDTATAGHGRRTQHNVSKMYSFSHIFGPDANQKEIFEHVVKDNLRKLPDGHSFTLLTYGASGSGKTYTLMGTVKAPGLVPRSLEYVFKVVEAAQTPVYRPGESKANKLNLAEQERELQWVRHLRHVSAPLRDKYRRMSTRLCSDMTKSTFDLSNRTQHYVWVSFVEIYNEAIYDLLDNTDRTAASKLRIREDPTGNVYVKGATQAFVRTGEEAYDVMVAGKHNLQVHATGVHAQSSRSHCIFTITMLTETDGGVRASYVRLCDLAGSERARRTRNTGARMAESRAINSSLHVLERCLHTLRRKQDLVPYRESKLTRLLGAGLSGTRGEAVSMVVTLNPAPEYAHETRHVLQLAAVARDIQVNNTIAESISTLESSCSQDTTIASSAEVVRLRADNERLHYELVQAQALNNKLMADMAEQQEENALTVKELVDEARDITQQYYKSQIHSLEKRHEAEIAELREEYEAKLAAGVVAKEGTPSRALQNKVMQLMKQIAILEEELNAERLARARMKEEMLHLRVCIEERDEKSSDNSNQEDAIQLTDSEDDSDQTDDICNDSLEPTFKKEDINRSRLLRQSSIHNNIHNTTHDMNTTHDTLKNDRATDKDITDATFDDSDRMTDKDMTDGSYDNSDRMTNKDMTDATYDDSGRISNKDMTDATYYDSKRDCTVTDEMYDASHDDSYNQSMDYPATVKKADVKKDNSLTIKEMNAGFDRSNADKHSARETYFVSKPDANLSGDTDKNDSVQDTDARNSVDTGISTSLKEDDDLKDFSIIDDLNVIKTVKPIETQIDKIKRFAISTVSSESSLVQFELMELEVNDSEKKEKSEFKYFDNDDDGHKNSLSPRKKEKKLYFDDLKPSPRQIVVVNDLIKKHDLLRSPSIIQEEIPENYEPTTINKIMRESFTVTNEVPPSLNKIKILKKMQDSIDPFEEVDSPCPSKQGVFKNIEIPRKSLNNEIDMKTKINDVVSEIRDSDNITIGAVPVNVTSAEKKGMGDNSELRKDAVLAEEVKLGDSKVEKEDVFIEAKLQSALKVEINDELTHNKDEDDVNHNILAELKDVHINSENVDPDMERKLITDAVSNETNSLTDITKVNQTISQDNNTIENFENIYKDITAPRATDFELLVSDEILATAKENLSNKIENTVNSIQERINEDPVKINKNKCIVKENHNKNKCNHDRIDGNEIAEVPKTNEEINEVQNTKYNLRQKTPAVKKSLRLRKRNKADEQVDDDSKLKDIMNLQKEFSDVTLGVPAPVKVVTNMPSPEKNESENQPPPVMGVQSCPSKSVSRRKLFTPRAEPLDESPPAGESAERIRVPRPSYHRTRTRRRLN